MARLKKHHAQQAADRLAAGERYQSSGLVMQTRWGTPFWHRNLQRSFDRLQDEAAAQAKEQGATQAPTHVTFHGLRHTHASWCLANGMTARELADRLGHTKISFTLQTYVHATPEAQRPALDTLTTAFWRKA